MLVGIEEGLKHEIHCDELVSLPKSILTNFIGNLSSEKLLEPRDALLSAPEL